MGNAKRDMNSYSENSQHFRQIFFQNFLPLRVEKIKVFHFTLFLALIAISSFYVIPAKANGTCYDVVDTAVNVSNKVLAVNVVTLTTVTNHGFRTNDSVTITGVGATFDGVYTITGVPAVNTFTYAKTAADVGSTPVTPVGVATRGIVLTDGSACSGTVNIGNNVTIIGTNAFSTFGISSVTIPSSVTSIEARAFENAIGLETVNFGENSQLTKIGEYAFAGAQRLTSISIPLGVTRIEIRTFLNTSVLSSISIPSSVTFIGESAFESALLLRDVNFGENSQLSEIDDWAFWNASSLTSISIPARVNTIGQEAFAGSESYGMGGRNSLKSVIFLGDAPLNLGADVFAFIASDAKAYVPVGATRFPPNGQLWNGLIVSRDTPPSDEDSDDSPPSGGGSDSPTFTPSVNASAAKAKKVDASFKLTNRKYLAKFEIKNALTKDRSFKRKPTDKYKYSISKASKKNCVMRGSYFMKLKEGGVCEITVTRTTNKGVKSNYQVKINYNN